MRKAHYAAEQLANVRDYRSPFGGPFFKEFVVESKKPVPGVLGELLKRGYHGGIDLGKFYPRLADCILVAVTEKRTKAEIDGLVEAFGATQ